jgi:hypothetical protein
VAKDKAHTETGRKIPGKNLRGILTDFFIATLKEKINMDFNFFSKQSLPLGGHEV